MAIFGNINTDVIVQINDKLRIDCRKSFVSKGGAEITKMEVDPDGSGFVDITGSTKLDWYLDWQFATDAASPYTISLRVTTDGVPVTFTKGITVVAKIADYLFSNDDDLKGLEEDIINWLPEYRNSFNYVHRRAQELILDELDNMGYHDKNGDRFVKADLIDRQEVKEWSVFKVLKMIFNSISSLPNDDFSIKSREYESKEQYHKNKNFLRIDYDKDGTLDTGEAFEFSTIYIGR